MFCGANSELALKIEALLRKCGICENAFTDSGRTTVSIMKAENCYVYLAEKKVDSEKYTMCTKK